MMVGVPSALMFKFGRQIKNNPTTRRRKESLERFYNQIPDPLFENGPRPFLFVNPSTEKLKKMEAKAKEPLPEPGL